MREVRAAAHSCPASIKRREWSIKRISVEVGDLDFVLRDDSVGGLKEVLERSIRSSVCAQGDPRQLTLGTLNGT